MILGVLSTKVMLFVKMFQIKKFQMSLKKYFILRLNNQYMIKKYTNK